MRAVAYSYERPSIPMFKTYRIIRAFLGRLFLMALPVPHYLK